MVRRNRESPKNGRETPTQVLDEVTKRYEGKSIHIFFQFNFLTSTHPGRPFTVPNLNTLESFIYHTRQKSHGDYDKLISSPPLVYASDEDTRLFLQFNLTVNVDGELHRIIGWAHPQLVFLTRDGRLNTFVDCTFKIVPIQFYQCMIVMIYHRLTGLYIPVFYVLLQGKQENDYYHAIQMVICACDWKFEWASVTCDYEKALQNALKLQAKDAKFIGCKFHIKQALEKQGRQIFKLPKDDLHKLLGPDGYIELLFIVPVEEIRMAIVYVRQKMDESKHPIVWANFWKYFEKTWLERYDPNDWNLCNINSLPRAEREEAFINKTNNPLERFNDTLYV